MCISCTPCAGVSAVGVALVASAAKGMAGRLCATPLTVTISTGATVVAYYWPKPYTFPAVIGLGGLVSLLHSYHKREQLPPVKVGLEAVHHMIDSREFYVLLRVYKGLSHGAATSLQACRAHRSQVLQM